ncbi:MAG: succinyl-diaminopimelate desuccinylase [Gammaproteobacteria bacterium]|nr:succinyl-diaminopimelate desuccinylase [Gammaproteobacteria bacterium]
MDSPTLTLSKQLLSIPSVTPDDLGCQNVLIQRLEVLGFTCETMQFGETTNLWARKGTEAPVLAFAGHTDVVPTGPVEQWKFDPFVPTEHEGMLYARGSADMKSSIACFVVACEQFLKEHANHKGSIAFLITSDEEGPAKEGTVKVIETLEARGDKITWALVGEPSSTNHVGDVVKNGRRGSLGAVLTVEGVQGHVAYPHLARNPLHEALPFLTELSQIEWDEGNEFFPPTSFQISNINAGTGATNVIPGHLEVIFNLRFSTAITDTQIKQTITKLLEKHQLTYTIEWNLSGQAFLTTEGDLVSAAQQAIKKVMGFNTALSTAGGTSDGRFIAPTGAQVLEVGPVNSTIHQLNECVKIDDLESLTLIYADMLRHLLK